MREIFYPLKVRDSDTASVGIKIRNHNHTLGAQHLIRCGGDWPIGRLDNKLCFNASRVLSVNDALECRGNEDVALGLERQAALCNEGCTREVPNTSRRINPLFHSGDIESRITHERSVALNDANDLGTVFER